ncbi:hypothetical protein KY290_021663 [Solanum tuberosum]|uniref:RNase H family protein n=1 Tax=Solanum tuberosum TaxID=4113 RepID=A0ABQ7V5B4_SOLTU|nr:hypothetical protein KY289_020829 [Solanum tuberosum]KAH0758170.1 hypothetical protein KY290_021663 [Solanum tuberosum]
MNDEGWDIDKMQQLLPARIVEHIGMQENNFIPSNLSDRPWWLLNIPLPETVQHLFIDGDMAKKVWSYFASAAGIQGPFIQIKQTVQKWRDVQERWQPRYSYKMVRWLYPPPDWYKCNTDGASKGNPGPSSAAFCVRNSAGDIIGAKGRSLSISTNLMAEVVAIRVGIHYCIERSTYLVKKFQELPMMCGINLFEIHPIKGEHLERISEWLACSGRQREIRE